jgi:hypothetical protein
MTRKTTGPASAKGSRPKPKLPPIPLFNWRTFDPAMLGDDDVLKEELTSYRDHLDELLKHEGAYVLIKGREVIGIFADKKAALQEAVNRFRDQPALVMQIVEKEPFHYLGSGSI